MSPEVTYWFQEYVIRSTIDSVLLVLKVVISLLKMVMQKTQGAGAQH